MKLFLCTLILFSIGVASANAALLLRSGETVVLLGQKVFCQRADDTAGGRIVLSPGSSAVFENFDQTEAQTVICLRDKPMP